MDPADAIAYIDVRNRGAVREVIFNCAEGPNSITLSTGVAVRRALTDLSEDNDFIYTPATRAGTTAAIQRPRTRHNTYPHAQLTSSRPVFSRSTVRMSNRLALKSRPGQSSGRRVSLALDTTLGLGGGAGDFDGIDLYSTTDVFSNYRGRSSLSLTQTTSDPTSWLIVLTKACLMDFRTLDYCTEGGVALITLARPDRMNAFNSQMLADLIAAFDHTDADDAVKAVVITGAGRAFCAGADMGSGADTFDRSRISDPVREAGKVGDIYRDGGGRVTLRIFDSLKPIIAAVNGVAVGVGATMLLPMDIRLASTESRFGFVFGRRGITPEAASSWFLPRLVGMQAALEWCYSGRVFSAQEALDRGLVRSMHEPQELLPAAIGLAREFAENSSTVSMALTRQLMWRGSGASHPMMAHQADSRAIQFCGQSSDAKEGVAAFLEKRPPQFSNTVGRDLPDIWPGYQAPDFV